MLKLKNKVLLIIYKIKAFFFYPKVYVSIDTMPIYNWFKINETNSYRWLVRKRRWINIYDPAYLNSIWELIFIEYLEAFGVPDALRKIMILKREHFVAQADLFLAEMEGRTDKFTILKIKLRQTARELAELTKEDKPEKVNLRKVYVQRSLPFRIDEKTMTVKEFYEHVQALEMEAELKAKAAKQDGRS